MTAPPAIPRAHRSNRSARALWPALAAIAYAALTVAYLRPIWRTFRTAIAPDPGDPLFLVYILKWGVHEAHRGFHGFWSAPFFFPARGVTALSEHMLGPTLLLTAWSAVDPDPVAFFNLLLAASFALCGLAACWVLARSGREPLAAFLGGAVFAFSHFRWEELGHLQILLAASIPLVLWSWDRLLAAPSPRRAAGFVVLYALHLSGSTYLAYMILFPLAALTANRLATPDRGRLADRRSLAVLLPTAALAAALAAAIFLPYWQEAHALHLSRSESEVRTYGTSLASFVTPSQRTPVGLSFPPALRRAENALFAGFLPTGLALAAGVALARRHRTYPVRTLSPERRLVLAALLVAAIVGYLAGESATWSATPYLRPLALPQHGYWKAFFLFAAALAAWAVLRRRWGGNWPFDLRTMNLWERGLLLSGALCLLLSLPLVYSVLMHVVPGLNGMRVPARFYPFLSFPIAHLAARGFEAAAADVAGLWGRWGRRAFAALVVAVVLAELMPLPPMWFPVEREAELPPVYAWIAGREDVRALLELPIGNVFAETAAMYRASGHWKPIVNGYSGYSPPPYPEVFGALSGHPFRPPDATILDRLGGWGVTHILVRSGSYRQPEERRALAEWEAASRADLVYDREGDRVYALNALRARQVRSPR